MDGRSEFFVYMGAALATVAGLFAVQIWYASYLDVAVVHAQDHDAPGDSKLEAVRSQEAAKLAGGAVPIEQAMKAVAERGRAASPKLAALPSDDLSAMSGWAHRPGFKAYEPRVPQAPVVPPAAEVTDGGVPVEGAEAAPAEAAPAAAPAAKIAVGVAKPAKPAVAKPVAAKKIAAPAPAAVPAAPAAAPQTP